MQQANVEDAHYPSIVFKLQNNCYAINCGHVSSIMQLPKYQPIPHAPKSIIGMVLHRGRPVPLLDIRSLFNLPGRREEHHQFADMIAARKTDHINWVNTLRHSVDTGEHFSLATDPHKCAFGKWYYNFKSDNQTLMYQMRKIEEPHRLLHESAGIIERCKQSHDCNFKEVASQQLDRAEHEYVNTVMKQLDDMVELFSEVADNCMTLVLEDRARGSIALVVDEVCSVTELELLPDNNHLEYFQRSSYLSGVASDSTLGMILVLDEEKIMDFAQYAELAEKL